ncbi:MAG: serine/threonine protein kinase [Candidatus Cloacimonetes bacterium]|nr:serine/threonine protein kinase [Candidatus Cloacimonadota bacterium]
MLISKDDKQYFSINNCVETQTNSYTLENTIEKLGAGGNAAVYECINSDGEPRAIKFLLNIGDVARKRFSQEIGILLTLDHPHIIKCYDFGEIEGIDIRTKKTYSIPFLVMEKADMNIVDYMRQLNGNIEYDTYALQIRELSDALNYIHKVAVHRDIKPENILVIGTSWLLSDFGLCTTIDEEYKLGITKTRDRIGPKFWLSPEAIDLPYFGNQQIDEASDVFQLCAVFWFIITKRYPLGLIEEDDYSTYDQLICNVLLKALKYNKIKRIPNGATLYKHICQATLHQMEQE